MTHKLPSHIGDDGSPPVDTDRVEVEEVYERVTDDGATELVEITKYTENDTVDGDPGAIVLTYRTVEER